MIKRIKQSYTYFALFIVLVIMLSGCTLNPLDLEGEWKSEDGNLYYSYYWNEDGTEKIDGFIIVDGVEYKIYFGFAAVENFSAKKLEDPMSKYDYFYGTYKNGKDWITLYVEESQIGNTGAEYTMYRQE